MAREVLNLTFVIRIIVKYDVKFRVIEKRLLIITSRYQWRIYGGRRKVQSYWNAKELEKKKKKIKSNKCACSIVK